MPSYPGRKKIRTATRVYLLLLVYIVAALAWWFISLMEQTAQMREFQLMQLNATIDSSVVPELYQREYKQVFVREKRARAKYIGEGITFLGITLLGSVFVFRSVRRQIRVQQQQQHFMTAVTHELKTPIAIIRLNLETLLKRKLEEQKQHKLLQASLQETERLNTLASNILVSSKLEGGGYLHGKENVDFSLLLAQSAKEFRQRFPDRIFQVQVEENANWEGDNMLFQLLINNLIDNALKYSPAPGIITLSLRQAGEGWEFSVADEGPGIPPEEKNKVFERFYRIGNENTRTAKGTGLGLYLCKKIAEDYKGKISLKDNIPSGCIFTVHFPLTS